MTRWVLGYAYNWQWAEKKGREYFKDGPEELDNYGAEYAREMFSKSGASKHGARRCVVEIPGGIRPCIALTDNATEESIKKRPPKHVIDKLKEFMGVDYDPLWYELYTY